MRWTRVPRKVARWTKFWGTQRSPEVALRSTDFRAPENLIFPVLLLLKSKFDWINFEMSKLIKLPKDFSTK